VDWSPNTRSIRNIGFYAFELKRNTQTISDICLHVGHFANISYWTLNDLGKNLCC